MGDLYLKLAIPAITPDLISSDRAVVRSAWNELKSLPFQGHKSAVVSDSMNRVTGTEGDLYYYVHMVFLAALKGSISRPQHTPYRSIYNKIAQNRARLTNHDAQAAQRLFKMVTDVLGAEKPVFEMTAHDIMYAYPPYNARGKRTFSDTQRPYRASVSTAFRDGVKYKADVNQCQGRRVMLTISNSPQTIVNMIDLIKMYVDVRTNKGQLKDTSAVDTFLHPPGGRSGDPVQGFQSTAFFWHDQAWRSAIEEPDADGGYMPGFVFKVAFRALLKCYLLRLLSVMSTTYYMTPTLSTHSKNNVKLYGNHSRAFLALNRQALTAVIGILPRKTPNDTFWVTAVNLLTDLRLITRLSGTPNNRSSAQIASLSYFLDKFRVPGARNLGHPNLSVMSLAHTLTQHLFATKGIGVYFKLKPYTGYGAPITQAMRIVTSLPQ
jgi:hypothetical protein